jgi:hypothetical protein
VPFKLRVVFLDVSPPFFGKVDLVAVSVVHDPPLTRVGQGYAPFSEASRAAL